MKKNMLTMGLIAVLFIMSCTKTENSSGTNSLIINHSNSNINMIPTQWISAAKQTLHIAYGHTSHGSQLIDGMTGLVSFKGSLYSWNNGGTGGALDLHDFAMSGDLGAPDRTNWAINWQNKHIQGTDWYSCSSAHSQPLNANQKAYAAWWLWARLAGWEGN